MWPLAPDCGLEFSSSLGRPVVYSRDVTLKWHSETSSSLCCIMPTLKVSAAPLACSRYLPGRSKRIPFALSFYPAIYDSSARRPVSISSLVVVPPIRQIP